MCREGSRRREKTSRRLKQHKFCALRSVLLRIEGTVTEKQSFLHIFLNGLTNDFIIDILSLNKGVKSKMLYEGDKDMLEKMREIIAEQLNCDGETIGLDTSFKDDLGADSLDLFELVMALEEEYGLEIPAEELSDVETVGDIIEYLKNKGVED